MINFHILTACNMSFVRLFGSINKNVILLTSTCVQGWSNRANWCNFDVKWRNFTTKWLIFIYLRHLRYLFIDYLGQGIQIWYLKHQLFSVHGWICMANRVILPGNVLISYINGLKHIIFRLLESRNSNLKL